MKAIRLFFSLLCFCIVGSEAQAKDTYWVDCTPSHINRSACWSAGLPSPSDVAIFANASTDPYTVYFPRDWSNLRTYIATDNVAFDLQGHTYLLGPYGGLVTEPQLAVGKYAGDIGQLYVSNGTLEVNRVGIGVEVGSNGTMVIGAGGRLDTIDTLSNKLIVGMYGTGNFLAKEGVYVRASDTLIGNYSGSWGEAIFTDSGTKLVGFGLNVQSGVAVFEDGAELNVSRLGIDALEDTSADVFIRGSETTTFSGLSLITIGASSTVNNGLWVEEGAVVASSTGRAQLGTSSEAFGRLTVTDAGSSVSWRNIDLGMFGSGQLNVLNGGHLSTNETIVGKYEGSSGSAVVDGTGSHWSSYRTYLGNEGSGELSILNGAGMSGDLLIVAADPGSEGRVTVMGESTSLALTSGMSIGSAGIGELTILAGGRVDAGAMGIGPGSSSMGTVTVTDPDSTLNTSGDLWVGASSLSSGGASLLSVANSGLVEVGGLLRARNDASIGIDTTATVSAAQLQVEKGAHATSHSGFVGETTAIEPGLTVFETATVTDAGSNWIVNDDLIIRDSGILHIDNEAEISVGGKFDVNSGGILSLSGGALNATNVRLIGGEFIGSDALINANLLSTSGGTISSGGGVDSIVINGNYSQSNDAALLIELAGSNRIPLLHEEDIFYGAVDISGNAFLDGALHADAIDGLVISAGDIFDILTSQVITGEFSSLLGSPGPGLHWEIQYLTDEIGILDVVRISAAVPIPATIWLFGSALGLLGWMRRPTA